MFYVFKLPSMLTSIAVNSQMNLSKFSLTFYSCVFGIIFTDLKSIFFVTSSSVSDTSAALTVPAQPKSCHRLFKFTSSWRFHNPCLFFSSRWEEKSWGKYTFCKSILNIFLTIFWNSIEQLRNTKFPSNSMYFSGTHTNAFFPYPLRKG